jgi:hypothetical protein
MTSDQKSDEDAREQRARHGAGVKRLAEVALSEAHQLCSSGNVDLARRRLIDACFQEEGIDYYLRMWRHE